MADLIPILNRPIGDEINAVDARELHRVLESKQDFSTWTKFRIEQLGLAEGSDFEKLNDSASTDAWNQNHSGIRRPIEYVFSLDAAKHVALAERTPKGKEVRAYFIACEKKLREKPAPLAALNDPAALRNLLLGYTERVLELEATVSEIAPKAATYDALMESADTYGFRESVKHLHRTTAVTEREVRTLLIDRGWVQRLGGVLLPASYGEQREYVTTRVNEYTDPKGVRRSSSELRITNKGLARLQKLLTRADAA